MIDCGNIGCVSTTTRFIAVVDFWAGATNEPDVKEATEEGVLFRLDLDLKLHRVIENVSIPNGVGCSVDNKTTYFTDSPTKNIFKFKLRSHYR